MRELNQEENTAVSGAGIISDAALSLGLGIGAIVDAAKNREIGSEGTTAGGLLGQGIGNVVEASLSTIGNIFGKLFNK